jgi:hypothetical protein
MFRELIDAIQLGMTAQIVEKDGISYTTRALKEFGEKNFTCIVVNSLDSLVTYAATQEDGIKPAYFVIESVREVSLVTAANQLGSRNQPIMARANPPNFNFGEYYDQEAFRIALATIFAETDSRNALLTAISKIEAGSIRESEDDGFSQSAALRKSVRMVGRADLAPIQTLHPYRTFLEIEQPESDFLLRLKDADSGVKCALFAADGGQWENVARQSIADYLEAQKTGIPVLR